MARKLKNMKLTSVDLVKCGANQEADICIYKGANPQEGAEGPTEREKNIFKRFLGWLRENPTEADSGAQSTIEKDYSTFDTLQEEQESRDKLWRYTDALTCSIRSIQEDNSLNADQKFQLMKKSLSEFDAAMVSLFEIVSKVKNDFALTEAVMVKSDSRYDVIEEVVKKKSESVEKFNPYHGKDGRFTTASGGSAGAAGAGSTSSFGNSSTKEFAGAVAKARESCTDDTKWRVTAHTQEELENDYPGAKLHVTAGGSTVAVTADGDIISVCKKAGDSVRGKELLAMGVENGGKKLDSFSGNHDFYTKCGFEPVSWTPFNEAYAPDGWRKGVDKPEPIVFYKYTGGKVNIPLDKFLSSTKPFEGDNGYDDAMKARDKSING